MGSAQRISLKIKRKKERKDKEQKTKEEKEIRTT
jgi:hypothetical protein